MTCPEHQNLFDGMTAVADAGGVEGFAREVIAEAKRLSMQQVSAGDPRDPQTIFGETIVDVVHRRMEPDRERQTLELAERLPKLYGKMSKRKIRRASERAVDKIFQRHKRCREVIFAAITNQG